jgi:DnaK suppressor protein
MKKVNKKIKKVTILAKKIVKKVAPKMSIKVKSKTKPKIKVKTKIAPKAKSTIRGKIKIKVKTTGKIKTPVKISVSNKNKTKKTVIKKSAGLVKNKKVITKKAVAPIKIKKIIAEKAQIKTPVSKDVIAKTKKAIKVINKVDKVNMMQISKPRKTDNLSPVVGKPYSSYVEEEYMNEQRIAHFKAILLEWKENLMESVDSTMHHMQDEAANYPDPVDRASQEEGFSLELRTRDRERKLLKKIDETLLRISEQDYGYCDDCGAEIGIRRLEARPTANQCIECKTIAEIREKQIGEIN